MSKVIIIGGGAAGMFAALGAADAGHQVTILEQNEKLGKEIHHRRLRRHVNSVCCSGRGQRRTDGDCVGRTGVRGNLHRPRCG